MDRPKIMCDLDGTLCNTPKWVSKYAKEDYGVGPGEVPYASSQFNMEDVWEGMNFQKLKRIFYKKDFWSSVPIFKGASEFTKQLGEWAEVYIATDRRWYELLKEDTRSYLVKNKIYFNHLEIIKGKEKKRYAEENSIVLAIEDKPETALALSEVCPVLLIGWPYNMEVSNDRIYRVDSYYLAMKIASRVLEEDAYSWNYFQSSDVIREE
jgi:uncharacterized HAD superfamily protein